MGQRAWELLWDAGRQHGLVAAGLGAFDTLRLEKGYRLWGQDIHTEHDPLEAGIGFAVRWAKDFQGKSALVAARERGVTRKLLPLLLDDPAAVVLGKEPIRADGEVVGYVTSAGYGYTIGRCIAYGYLPVELAAEGTTVLLDRGWAPNDVLNQALVEGMRIVGIDFRDGILFVPEVLLAANAMKAGMAILRPLLAETGVPRVGKVVIGTVKGDIHDIGKNLVGMMLEGAGFEVVDLGINNPVERYLAALDEHHPDILGMSALLTTTMPYMKVVIDELVAKGIRDDYIVLVGGAPLNEEFGKAIGADAYCRDAAVAAETAQALVRSRRAAAGTRLAEREAAGGNG